MAEFYLVGGAVRDRLMGIAKPKDLDFTVEAESFDAMREAIVSRNATIFLEQEPFLTIRAKMEFAGERVDADFVLARKESDSDYNDGRRPNQVVAGTLLDDLSRRDFTMNAIAQTEEGVIIDPFNGAEDIENRLIRAVGEASDRFDADRLRVLRAVRFAVTKEFRLHNGVSRAIESDPSLAGVSAERIAEEVNKMFRANRKLAVDFLFTQFPRLGAEVLNAIGLEATMKPQFTK